MTLQCANCPGANNHSTANCPLRPDLYADSAQARAGTELRQPVASGEYDWRTAADRRERDAVAMRARVLVAVELLATKLRMR